MVRQERAAETSAASVGDRLVTCEERECGGREEDEAGLRPMRPELRKVEAGAEELREGIMIHRSG